MVQDNGSMVVDTLGRPNINPRLGPAPDFDERVSPQNFEAEYYQFTIENFGWFNIDILLKMLMVVKKVNLFVRIVGEYRQKIEVYLIIPSMKVYGEGGLTERTDDEYAFDKKNGQIPCPKMQKLYTCND